MTVRFALNHEHNKWHLFTGTFEPFCQATVINSVTNPCPDCQVDNQNKFYKLFKEAEKGGFV